MTRDIAWAELSRKANATEGRVIPLKAQPLPVWRVHYATRRGQTTRYFTGEENDLNKWLDDLNQPFAKIERCG